MVKTRFWSNTRRLYWKCQICNNWAVDYSISICWNSVCRCSVVPWGGFVIKTGTGSKNKLPGISAADREVYLHQIPQACIKSGLWVCDTTKWSKYTYDEIQGGGRHPYWKWLNGDNSAPKCPTLLKFGMQVHDGSRSRSRDESREWRLNRGPLY